MVFQPIYIPPALNNRNHVLATANTGKIGRSFGKNAGEWTGSVEISNQKNPWQ